MGAREGRGGLGACRRAAADVGAVVAGVALWFGTVCWVVGIEAERCERRFRMIEQASSETPPLGPGEGSSVELRQSVNVAWRPTGIGK